MDTSLSQSGRAEAIERLFLRRNRSPTVEDGPSTTGSPVHLLRGHRGTSSPSERTQPGRRPYRYLEPGSEPAGTLPLLKAISRVTWGTLKRRRLREREAQPQAAPNDPRGRGPPPPAALGSPQRRPALPVPDCRHPSHTAPPVSPPSALYSPPRPRPRVEARGSSSGRTIPQLTLWGGGTSSRRG